MSRGRRHAQGPSIRCRRQHSVRVGACGVGGLFLLVRRIVPGTGRESSDCSRPDRLGFNMAWLAAFYLTYQLISIPFSLPSAGNRFIGVVDGMASLVPLAVVLIVVFGKPQLVGTPQRWEAAFLLIFITIVDLFGGYTFNLALSRRTMDVDAGVARRECAPLRPRRDQSHEQVPQAAEFCNCFDLGMPRRRGGWSQTRVFAFP